MSPEDIRRAADEIVGRPEFQVPEPSLIERAQDWVSRQIGEILTAAANGGAGSLVGILVVLALVALVVWFAVRYGRTVQVDARVGGFTVEGVHRRSPGEWRAEAERFEAAGQWKEALRARYRALVGDLVAEGLLDDVAGRTTGELRADLAARAPERAADFGAASELFELAWYADRPTGPEESARFQALAAAAAGVRT
jgi:hypothetical protein